MKKFTLLFFVSFCIFSCKKESFIYVSPSDLEEKPSEYLPLAIGNYWVYEIWRIRPNEPDKLTQLDTITIARDTFIGADRFYIINKSGASGLTGFPDLIGLINHHPVNADKQTILSLNHNDTLSFTDLGEFQFFTIIKTDNIPEIAVPAGIFSEDLVNQIIQVEFKDFDTQAIVDTEIFPTYFAKGVGMIYKESAFINSPGFGFEIKLKEYHLN